MTTIFIDADGCPVKDETYRVARRYDLPVRVVANRHVNIPAAPGIECVVVRDRHDAADDWIAEHVGGGDIVVTADIPLAARCINAGARVPLGLTRGLTE